MIKVEEELIIVGVVVKVTLFLPFGKAQFCDWSECRTSSTVKSKNALNLEKPLCALVGL